MGASETRLKAVCRRYEDFAECFSLWCDEQPENAATIFNLVSSRLESSITVSRPGTTRRSRALTESERGAL